MERTSSAKLDKMLSIQKSAFDQTGLGYDFSSSSIAFASTTVFVPLAKKAKKKEAKNPRAKKANSQKSKQKKQQLCHHCGVAGHTRPNCYKWLATQQSNGMASGSQNQLQSFLAPLRDLLKAFMFLLNLNGFNSFPSPPVQGFNQRKGSSKVWKKKNSK